MAESVDNENETRHQCEERETVFPKDSIDIENQIERAVESYFPFVVKKLIETVEKDMSDSITRMIREEVVIAVKEEFQKRDDKEHLYRKLKKSLKEKIELEQTDTFSMLVDVARSHELECMRTNGNTSKRKAEEITPASKKYKQNGNVGGDSASKNIPFCNQCRRNHTGICRMASKNCYNCGKPGHISKNCMSSPSNLIVCFKCYQTGHMRSSCPILGEEGTERRNARMENNLGDRMSQLMVEEATNTDVIVTGIVLCIVHLCKLFVILKSIDY